MALIGTIMVNNQTIGGWSAVRVSGGDEEDDRNVYNWDVALNADAHYGSRRYHGSLRHNYMDGALILASEVLQQAVEQMERTI